MDLVALYTDTQARIIDLVGPLAAPALATPVPGTPRWTVAQLVCHLAGGCADIVDGNTEGVATEAWTERQVVARQDLAWCDIVAEWQERTPALLALLATPGRVDALAFDLLTHEHDLRGAFAIAGPSDAAAVFDVTTRVTGRLGHMVEKAALPPLRLVNDTDEWVCGAGFGAGPGSPGAGSPEVGSPGAGSPEVGVTGTASTMEWFRALFGRRSAAQVLTYDWDGDPEPYFGLLNLFGPLPAVDVAEAGAPFAARDIHDIV